MRCVTVSSGALRYSTKRPQRKVAMQSAAAVRSASGATSVARSSVWRQRSRHAVARNVPTSSASTSPRTASRCMRRRNSRSATRRANSWPAWSTIIVATGPGWQLAQRGRRVGVDPEAGPVDLAGDRRLGLEVVVEAGDGDVGRVGELAHADGRGPPLREEAQRGLHDPLAGGEGGARARGAHGPNLLERSFKFNRPGPAVTDTPSRYCRRRWTSPPSRFDDPSGDDPFERRRLVRGRPVRRRRRRGRGADLLGR